MKKMKLKTLWMMLVIFLALLFQKNCKERKHIYNPCRNREHHLILQHTQSTIKLSSPVVSQLSSLVVLSSPLFLQLSAPTQTASLDENSDTSTSSPTHKHVRTRGGTVKQATGRRIQTREDSCGATANSWCWCW